MMIDEKELTEKVNILIEERDFYYSVVEPLREVFNLTKDDSSFLIKEKVHALHKKNESLEEQIKSLELEITNLQEEKNALHYTVQLPDDELNLLDVLRTEFALKADEPSSLLSVHVCLMKETIASLQEKVTQLKLDGSLYQSVNVGSDSVQEVLKLAEEHTSKPSRVSTLADSSQEGFGVKSLTDEKLDGELAKLQEEKNSLQYTFQFSYKELNLFDVLKTESALGVDEPSSLLPAQVRAMKEKIASLQEKVTSLESNSLPSQSLEVSSDLVQKVQKISPPVEESTGNDKYNKNEKQKKWYGIHSLSRAFIAGSILFGFAGSVITYLFLHKKEQSSEIPSLEYVINANEGSQNEILKPYLRRTEEQEECKQRRKMEDPKIKIKEQKKINAVSFQEFSQEMYHYDDSTMSVYELYEPSQLQVLDKNNLDNSKVLDKSKGDNKLKGDDESKGEDKSKGIDKSKVDNEPVVNTKKPRTSVCGSRDVNPIFDIKKPANWNDYTCRDFTENKDGCYKDAEYLPSRNIIAWNNFYGCSSTKLCCPPLKK